TDRRDATSRCVLGPNEPPNDRGRRSAVRFGCSLECVSSNRSFLGKCSMLRFLIVTCLLGGMASAAEPFVLQDGDTVTFVGNTFIEREQRDGEIELALTLSAPEANVSFRNLGWSGDTVSGRARRFFGSTDDGFKHLLDHLDLVKPTVIF